MTTGRTMQQRPSLSWRVTSSAIFGVTSAICRSFLYGLNNVEVVGLDPFLKVLDRRKDVQGRTRGLVTVSNHVGVLDDPLIWGVLPLVPYGSSPGNHRWGLGAHDICFKNQFLSAFFSRGQVLPTHRLKHAPDDGGLFQPTMTQAIRLLSDQPYYTTIEGLRGGQLVTGNSSSHADHDLTGTGPLVYTSTNSTRHPPQPNRFPSPSGYSSNRHSWLHVFPEGMVHQSPTTTLRYFKWGISRLLLESEPRTPEIIPIFIDGTQHIMPEARKWPRFAPRWGKKVTIVFGESRDGEEVVGDLRARWRDLVRRVRGSSPAKRGSRLVLLGEVPEEQLRVGEEAQAIRTETALRMRNQVLALRRSVGFADEDPAARLELAETWKEDRETTVGGHKGKKYKSKVDDSLINQD